MTSTVDADRRRLLATLAWVPFVASALVACSDDAVPKASPGPRPDVDVKVRWRAVAGERALLALYDATVAAHPGLGDRLEPQRANHEQHLAVLEAAGPLPVAAVGPPDAPAVASAAAEALAAIRTAERASSEARAADCLAASGSRLATILASIAACEAAHDARLAAS